MSTELTAMKVEDLKNKESVANALLSAVASKQHGFEHVLAPLIADACVRVCPKNPLAFNVDNVRVVKLQGGGVGDTRLVQGMVLERGPEGVVRSVLNAKVAVFGAGIDVAKTETKGTVLIQNAEELLDFSKGEETQVESLVPFSALTTQVELISIGALWWTSIILSEV